ncbi:MAG: hypothetical protein ACQKBW_09025, partial [Puniceicoccales bacterium]
APSKLLTLALAAARILAGVLAARVTALGRGSGEGHGATDENKGANSAKKFLFHNDILLCVLNVC